MTILTVIYCGGPVMNCYKVAEAFGEIPKKMVRVVMYKGTDFAGIAKLAETHNTKLIATRDWTDPKLRKIANLLYINDCLMFHEDPKSISNRYIRFDIIKGCYNSPELAGTPE